MQRGRGLRHATASSGLDRRTGRRQGPCRSKGPIEPQETAWCPGFAGIILLMVVAGCANTREPPGGNFRKISELVRFPGFYPDLGTLYGQPDTLPEGALFYGYDWQGRWVDTVYMLPIRLLDAHAMLDALQR